MARRNLILLLVLAALATVAAVWALVDNRRDAEAELKPGPAFPALLDRVNDVAEIRVATRDTTVRIKRTEKGQWVVASHEDYSARPETVRRTIFALIEAKIVDRASGLPENHSKLGLVSPDRGGAATRVVLLDQRDNRLAALLIGKPLEAGQPLTTAKEFFARKPDEDQAWIVHGDFPVEASAPLWLDPQIADIDRTRIRSATLSFPDGTRYTVSRKAPDQPDFVLASVPDGREPATGSTAANDFGAAASILSFEDVRPIAKIPLPEKTPHAVYRTFDGLVLDIGLVPAEGRTWAIFQASVDPASAASASAPAQAESQPEKPAGPQAAPALPLKSLDAVKADAAAISARVAGWAYRLPDTLARDMSRPLEDLLAPKKAEPAKAKEPKKAKKKTPKSKAAGERKPSP